MIFLWGLLLSLFTSVLLDVFYKPSDLYQDYTLVFIAFFAFLVAGLIFQWLINAFINLFTPPEAKPKPEQSKVTNIINKLIEFFIRAILYSIVLAVGFLYIFAAFKSETVTYLEVIRGLFGYLFSIIIILFIEWWLLGNLISKRWRPLAIKKSGNARLLHIGWLNVLSNFLSVYIIFILINYLLSSIASNVDFAELFSFLFLAGMWFGSYIVIMIKVPNSFIFTSFSLKTKQVTNYSIKLNGIFLFVIFWKRKAVVSAKKIPFDNIAYVRTWVQTIEATSYNAIAFMQKYDLFKFPTVGLNLKQAESTEDKEIVLVRGQYLDMEKTKADIESILNKSI